MKEVGVFHGIFNHFLEEFIGNYTLSFWWNGRVQHGRIKSTTQDSQPKFFLVDKMLFDSVQDLIIYYKSHRYNLASLLSYLHETRSLVFIVPK